MKQKTLTTIIVINIVLAVILGLAAVKVKQIAGAMSKGMAAAAVRPIEIQTAAATVNHWPEILTGYGSVLAVQGVELTTQQPGRVMKILFQSDQYVKTGTPLLKLDTTVLQAQLKKAEAQLVLAKKNLARNTQLIKKEAISASSFDSDQADFQSQQATVDQIKAQIELSTIRAPFDGRLGLRYVNLGEYISTGTIITNLHSEHPIYIDYNIPQNSLAKLKKGQTVSAKVSAFPNTVFQGKIDAIDQQINQETRAVKVRAIFDNKRPHQLLTPGMFVKAETHISTEKPMLSLPRTAIDYSLYGASVFRVEQDPKKPDQKIAKRVYVDLGPVHGNEIAITHGLKQGDQVATTGLVKLSDGALVTIKSTPKG